MPPLRRYATAQVEAAQLQLQAERCRLEAAQQLHDRYGHSVSSALATLRQPGPSCPRGADMRAKLTPEGRNAHSV